MQLAHVSPSGLRGGDHAFAARIWLEDDVVYISGELGRTTAQLVGASWLAVGNAVDDAPIQEAV
jgi:hypothetical protein